MVLRRQSLPVRLSFAALLTVACGAEPPPPAAQPAARVAVPAPPPPPAPPAPPPVRPAPFDVDPVLVGLGRGTAGPGTAADAALARAGIDRLCDESIARARATLDEIKTLDG